MYHVGGRSRGSMTTSAPPARPARRPPPWRGTCARAARARAARAGLGHFNCYLLYYLLFYLFELAWVILNISFYIILLFSFFELAWDTPTGTQGSPARPLSRRKLRDFPEKRTDSRTSSFRGRSSDRKIERDAIVELRGESVWRGDVEGRDGKSSNLEPVNP